MKIISGKEQFYAHEANSQDAVPNRAIDRPYIKNIFFIVLPILSIFIAVWLFNASLFIYGFASGVLFTLIAMLVFIVYVGRDSDSDTETCTKPSDDESDVFLLG